MEAAFVFPISFSLLMIRIWRDEISLGRGFLNLNNHFVFQNGVSCPLSRMLFIISLLEKYGIKY